MEDLLRENATLKETIQRLESQVKEYRDMETTLRETLLTAQQMVEDYKNKCKKGSRTNRKRSRTKGRLLD